MEITSETHLKIKAQYVGQKARYSYYPPWKTHFISLNHLNQEDILILKPLSSITDEDTLEVANILGFGTDFSIEYRLKIGKTFTERGDMNGLKLLQAYQYLQLRGYDLPQYLLNGKTLKEAGLAMYKNDIK